MKKLITIFILCFLTGIATVHAAYQRHQKQPNFFMPAGAMQNTVNKPIVPPQQTIRQKPVQNKAQQISKNNLKTQTPKKEDTTPIKTAKPEKEAAAPQIQTAAEKPTKAEEKIKSAENPAPNPLKTAEKTENLPVTPLLPEKENLVQISNNQPETEQTPPVIAQNIPVINEKPSTNAPKQDAYSQSFKEYDEDLQTIAAGKTGFNQRLQEMLADFKNQEHKISFSVK